MKENSRLNFQSTISLWKLIISVIVAVITAGGVTYGIVFEIFDAKIIASSSSAQSESKRIVDVSDQKYYPMVSGTQLEIKILNLETMFKKYCDTQEKNTNTINQISLNQAIMLNELKDINTILEKNFNEIHP